MNPQPDHPYTAEEIRRYLKGEMSEAEMHALEKAALDDPMLADAIEGFQASLAERGELNTMQDIDALNRAFAKRHHPTPVRSFPVWQVAAAAVVIIIAGVVTFNYFNKPEEQLAAKHTDTTTNSVPQKETVYKNPDTADAISPSVDGANVAEKSKHIKGGIVGKTKPPKETNVDNTATLERVNVGKPVPPEQSNDVTQSRKSEDEQGAGVRRQTDSLSIKTETAAPQASREAVVTGYGTAKQNAVFNAISGRVVNNNMEPLANAVLTPSDASMQAYNSRQNRLNTDRAGYFNLLSPDTSLVVKVTANGYREQLFRLRNNPAQNQLVLQPELKGKVSGVAVSKKAAGNPSQAELQNAIPVGGWESFNAYIEKNKIYPAENSNLAGAVIVSFQVNNQGKPGNFKIIQSLAKGFDDEAIRLIKEGPKWNVTKGRRATMQVTINF